MNFSFFASKYNYSETAKLLNTSEYIFNIDNYEYYNVKTEYIAFNNIIINYQFIKRILNKELKIPLYIIVGISKKSFLINLIIIDKNIEKIKNKYSEIIFFICDENIKKKFGIENYTINDTIQKKIASHYNDIIQKINNEYKQFDLIGVSFGGGVSVYISQINYNIRNLILMCPGINEGLINIPKHINILLGWCKQDTKIPLDDIGIKLITELKNFNNKYIIIIDLYMEKNTDITNRLQYSIFDVMLTLD